MVDSYIMYHCHTEDSLLDSATKYQDYIDLAVANGQKAISFSEHGKPLQWTEKWAACKNAGIKYMHSVEIYLTETLEEKIRDNYHTVLIAKNWDGVLELNSLVSKSCDEEHSYYKNRLSFEEFLGISNNIITTSACLASPLNRLPEDHPMYEALVKRYDFLEVQGHHCQAQIDYNKRLVKLAKKYNKPLIAGTDTHNSSKYKDECRDVLLATKGFNYENDGEIDLCYKTYDELVELFRTQGALTEEEYMAAINNTNLLIDMTDEIELDTAIKYPILYGTKESDIEKLEETIDTKFNSKLHDGIIPAEQKEDFEENMKEEMRVFKKLGMCGFILSMSELVSWCKENGIAIGPARGSVGGSRVAYVTDIIDLNPETWNTVFSRFCNEDREEIGDIDIDCIESDRPRIFKHIIDKFGEDKTARVASFGTLQDRAVIDLVGKYLSNEWEKCHSVEYEENPWSLKRIKVIKKEYEENPERTEINYPELFYYMDGLLGVKISQSVHPAGMVISPITLADNYGVFRKDGELCLMLDMDNIHDYTGLAKYDFLVLKTVQVVRDACKYAGIKYPKSHEMNWEDENVWNDIIRDPTGIFQFEGNFAYDCLKKFKPRNLFDMSLVTAAVRPSGASYRDELLARKTHHNPAKIIDDLLSDSLSFLVYQEQTIKFLQQICGLSGSEADNIRRAIGRKQKDRLDEAMPKILDGYCSKSNLPRAEAEEEAKEFLQVIEDSASYQFGYNHSIAYCMLGYYCAYLRYYYKIEFITSFLNNAANDNDIKTGTVYAQKNGIKVTMPRWGVSRSQYFFDKEKGIIAKGLSSIKYMSKKLADEMYTAAHKRNDIHNFVDVLEVLNSETSIDSRQLDILIKIDFFAAYGNQRELLRIVNMFNIIFKKGEAKKINKVSVANTPLEKIISRYSSGETKAGKEAKSYTITNMHEILVGMEEMVLNLNLPDLEDKLKIENFKDIMGYAGYVSGKEEDRKKLYVLEVYELKRKRDNKQFGYSIITKSVGSGVESRFTVFNNIYNNDPIKEGDLIYCNSFKRDGIYFTLTGYEKILW